MHIYLIMHSVNGRDIVKLRPDPLTSQQLSLHAKSDPPPPHLHSLSPNLKDFT